MAFFSAAELVVKFLKQILYLAAVFTAHKEKESMVLWLALDLTTNVFYRSRILTTLLSALHSS
jgi:hypothetical protein